MELQQDNRYYLLKLINIPGLGPARIQQIHEYYPELSQLFQSRSAADLKQQFNQIPERILKDIREFPYQNVLDHQLALIEKYHIGLLIQADEDYPILLRRIASPPPLIFYRGDLSCLKQPLIAVIGTRRPTPYGIEVTRMLVGDLVSKGQAGIVSGLAEGLDTVAHRACLDQGGHTVSVFGTGPDHIYPAANHRLAEEIINRGVTITQFLPGCKINPANFALRNRMISGISAAVLITEAGMNSGSLITARFALSQNHPVFAVPGSILSKQNRGGNSLIRDKTASCITQAEDLMKSLPDVFPHYSHAPQGPAVRVTSREYDLLLLMEQGHTTISELRGLLPSELQFEIYDILLGLELKGLIRQLPGMNYQLLSVEYQTTPA